MKLTCENENYAFTIVKVGEDIPLKGRDRIVHKNIGGNKVITSKGTSTPGDLMIYIPVEVQLSEEFCRENNLNDKSEYNKDTTQKGYISYKKRRVKAISLGGFESNGMLMPLESLKVKGTSKLKEGDTFDSIDGVTYCNKYVPPLPRNGNPGGSNPNPHENDWAESIDYNQFRFHVDTPNANRLANSLRPTDIIQITQKFHGSSGISSNVLCDRKLGWKERVARWFGIPVETKRFLNVYSSGKPKSRIPKGILGIKETHDIWWHANHALRPFLDNGMTLYYEIVGYTPTGGMVQKPFDYGCKAPYEENGEVVYKHGEQFETYIYRITTTSSTGNVYEFSYDQVQEWCKKNGLKAVVQEYDGPVGSWVSKDVDSDNFGVEALEAIAKAYWTKQCKFCVNKVPSEGVVIRKRGLGLNVMKWKNFEFLKFESKILDTATEVTE